MRLRYWAGMIWSVSTSARLSGMARPRTCSNFCMAVSSVLAKRADIDEMAGDGGGRGHLRADQVGAPAAALAAFEVAVGGGGAALAGEEDIGVHAQAHGAAGLAPFVARII